MSNCFISDGLYQFRPEALARYQGVDAAHFGSVTISLPDGRSVRVRDFHYSLANGQLGMQILPVSDEGAVQQPDGSWASGSSIVDRALRTRMQLADASPIYAIAAYIRPEEHHLTLDELLSSKKLFFGYKHVGAYLGDGVTTHAPQDYHSESWRLRGHNAWGVRGYPATLFVLSLDGIDQVTLNRNARIVDAVLNTGVLAPHDFERMQCRASTLNSTLQFYRDWIRQESYLTDYSWFMSCGDHKAAVINVMLNVPHNHQSFLEIFGDDGALLWSEFKQRYATILGHAFQSQDETDFEPLWKKEQLRAEEIRPLSLSQQNAFDAAIVEKRLESFEGARPLPSGVGMAWPMETPIDLLTGFISTYLRFLDVGGIVIAAAIVRLAAQAPTRLGISESQYCSLVSPVVARLLMAEAKQHVPRQEIWLAEAKAAFRRCLVGTQASTSGESWPEYHASRLQEECFLEIERQLPYLARGQALSQSAALEWLNAELASLIVDLRRKATNGQLVATFFTTPGVFHRIATGAYPCSKFVSVVTVCTVVDHTELELRRDSPGSVDTTMTEQPSSNSSTLVHQSIPGAMVHRVAGRSGSLKELLGLLSHTQRARTAESAEPAVLAALGRPQLVYAVGQLGYDFATEASYDAFRQEMRRASGAKMNPLNPRDLIGFLCATHSSEPWHADSMLWTLSLSATPLYVIRPEGPFARECYDRLLQLFAQQVPGKSERVVVPGTISGQAKLLDGRTIPVIIPDPRGLRSWAKEEVIETVKVVPSSGTTVAAASSTLQSILDRVFEQTQNPGLTPQDRAMNFAGTSILECRTILKCLKSRMALDSICAERSTVCRPGSDCWDIILTFFSPDKPLQTMRNVYRYTVDVGGALPVTVGEVRSWNIGT